MGKHCRIHMLGQLRLQVGEANVARFRTYKTGALLAYLAYALGKPVPREELIEMLWPDTAPDQARNSVSQALSSLRHILEPIGTPTGQVLEAGRHTVRLVEEACETDVGEFRALAANAKASQIRQDEARWESLAKQAVSHFGGEFLPGIYEDWTLAPREHLREEAVALLGELARVCAKRGDARESLAHALHATTLDVTREESHRTAIRAYDAFGQPEAALKQYRSLEKALASLGLKPSEETRGLVKDSLRRERASVADVETSPLVQPGGTPTWVKVSSQASIESLAEGSGGSGHSDNVWRYPNPDAALQFARAVLSRDPSARVVLVTSASPEGARPEDAASGQILADATTAALLAKDFVDLGQFEIAGVRTRLYAAAETAFAPEAQRPATSLISGLTRFFGREEELDAVAHLIGSGTRLVTLTGPGGMGKTRLSLEVARRVEGGFSDGVLFVKLETATRGSDIWESLASALQLVPPTKTSARDLVLGVLGEGRRLLVLDNFEQLCDAGGPEVVAEILGHSAEVVAVVSSRRRLDIEGEVEFPLRPLPSPEPEADLETASLNPAVALFLDRAKAAKPDFQLTEGTREAILTLCARLDGIPLALELAAARIQVLTTKQILQRFDERLDLLTAKSKVERHRSLRNAIDWSYSYLSEELQIAFRRLGIFQGGWDESAAELVLAVPVALDVLAELRDFSLISAEPAEDGSIRFSMLETLREFARQRCDPAEWEELREAHANAVAVLTESSEALLEGPEQIGALAQLERNAANLRQAVEWALEQRDTVLGLRLCSAAWRFWHLKSHLGEGRAFCERVLELESGPDDLRAKVLNAQGRLAYLQGDYGEARKLHEAAFELAGDVEAIQAMSLNALGAVAYEEGHYAEAVDLFKRALDLRRAMSDRFGAANALSWLGIVLTEQGSIEEAKSALEESLVLRREIGDLSGIARSYNSLGVVERRLGDLERANDYYERALETQREMGDRRAIGGLLSNLAMVAHQRGDLTRSAELLEEAHRINKELGDKWTVASIEANQALVALESGDVKSALRLSATALAARWTMNNRWGVAFSMEGCARVLLEAGDCSSAARALACAERIRSDLGAPLSKTDQERVEATMAALKSNLGATSFAAAWSEGQAAAEESLVNATLDALAPDRARP